MKKLSRTLILFIIINSVLLHFLHAQVTQSITTPGIYSFSPTHVEIQFTAVPEGGGNVTVSDFLAVPVPAPSGGSVSPYYITISTDMPDYSYTAVINIINASSLGLGTQTQPETPNIDNTGWIILNNQYQSGIDVYSFSASKFGVFSFLEPTVAPNQLYICSDPINPESSSEIYASDVKNTYGPSDWEYTPDEQSFSIYITPENLAQFYACDLYVQWDNSKLEFQSIVEGDIWPASDYNFFTFPETITDHIILQASAQNAPPTNVVGGGGKYIAKINFKKIHPDFASINIVNCVFRDADNNPVYFIPNPAKSKYYLGDFDNPVLDGKTGDGNVDFNDLIPFAAAYNSTSTGWSGSEWLPSGTTYRRKFDIGPTNTNSIFGVPQPDNKVQFEDLILFSISYGFSNSSIYPKSAAGKQSSATPVKLIYSYNERKGSSSRILSGKRSVVISKINDLKGFHFEFDIGENTDTFLEAEKIELLANEDLGFTFFDYKCKNGILVVDGAIFTRDGKGISYEGPIFNLRFQDEPGKLNLLNGIIRDSKNNDYPFDSGEVNETDPATFSIFQNHPNPFNLHTTFELTQPRLAKVNITIYNSLGQKVKTLLSRELSPGNYRFSWDSINDGGQVVPSGVYFATIQTNNIYQTIKMLLIK